MAVSSLLGHSCCCFVGEGWKWSWNVPGCWCQLLHFSENVVSPVFLSSNRHPSSTHDHKNTDVATPPVSPSPVSSHHAVNNGYQYHLHHINTIFLYFCKDVEFGMYFSMRDSGKTQIYYLELCQAGRPGSVTHSQSIARLELTFSKLCVSCVLCLGLGLGLGIHTPHTRTALALCFMSAKLLKSPLLNHGLISL